MGVQELLVLVCLLCTIMSVDGLQLFVLWESSLLLYPVFQTGESWIHCKLSGMSWMTSVLLVNHRCWYIWGTAWQIHAVAWCYHLHQCQPCTWELQVVWVQSQLASGQSQRLLLLSLSKHWISQLFQDQLHSSYAQWLVIPCEVMSAEQLWQHQPHHNGGLHQFQLHWPSSVFLLCCGIYVHFGIWASSVLSCHIHSICHPMLGMKISQVGGTLCSVHMSAHCLLEVSCLDEVCFASLWHLLSSVPSIPWPQGCLRWQCVFDTLQASWVWMPSGQVWAASWWVPYHWGFWWVCTGHSVPFPLLLGSYISQQEYGDGQQVHLVTLWVRCKHLPVDRSCSIVTLHDPS